MDTLMTRPPVLLVHGAFSSASDLASWTRLFEAEGFQVMAPSLPGHEPSDPKALRSLSLDDYLRALVSVRQTIAAPPIVVGHSMGGLLAQRLAARTTCRALVCVASAPLGMLTAQPRAIPYLAPLLPRILAGLPIRPSAAAFRALALHDLPPSEQDAVAAGLGHESGLAYRAMIFGTGGGARHSSRPDCPVLCLSGGIDRIVSRRLARSIAARYDAEHQILPTRGHWLIAPSAAAEVTGRILEWLARPAFR
jgi:pimeloyl-ACP methyl ester carboxylesterase